MRPNSAERRCLSFVSQGPQAASAIAKETKLTPAAIVADRSPGVARTGAAPRGHGRPPAGAGRSDGKNA